MKLPRYSEGRLAVAPVRVYCSLDEIDPDHVHIAAEWPLGAIARFWRWRRGVRFTSTYHTRVPEYVKEMYWLPSGPVTRYVPWFHWGSGPYAGADADREGRSGEVRVQKPGRLAPGRGL